MDVKKILKEIYLEYWNDYLTVAKMAEHNQMAEEDLQLIINMGRFYFNLKGWQNDR